MLVVEMVSICPLYGGALLSVAGYLTVLKHWPIRLDTSEKHSTKNDNKSVIIFLFMIVDITIEKIE
jgi:hypothetical protein